MQLSKKRYLILELDHPCAHGETNNCWREPKKYPDDICNYDLRCNGIDDYPKCLSGTIELKKYDESNCSGIIVIITALLAYWFYYINRKMSCISVAFIHFS